MSHAYRIHGLRHISSILPGSLSSQAQLWPVHVPVQWTGKLAVKDSTGGKFQGDTMAGGNHPGLAKPGDGLPVQPKLSGNFGLGAAPLESAGDGRGQFFIHHDDIVSPVPSNGKQDDDLMLTEKDVAIWHRVADYLHERRLNDAWLARQLGISRQVVGKWKTRGVPSKRYEDIAALFGWTLDRLLTGEAQEPVAAQTPAKPDRHPGGDGLSPMALDLAKMFDECKDDQQRRRAYALMVQVMVMAPPAPPVAPKTPAQHPAR